MDLTTAERQSQVREAIVDGRPLVSFCSNDYLGLSQDPRLIEAAQEATARLGTGAGGSRLVGGTTEFHTDLEKAVARWKGAEAALVFNSGYQANVPQLDAEVDRIKTKTQGIALTDLFATMQIYLGSAYVNDFNLFGRTWQVKVQAEKLPLVLPPRDGGILKARFRRAVLGEEADLA